MPRIKINITAEDIAAGVHASAFSCPAAIALTRALDKPAYAWTTFGTVGEGKLGNTPKNLFKWMQNYDRSRRDHKLTPKPASFTLTYKKL